jgi:hypothetical protein
MDELDYYVVPAKVIKGADHLVRLSKMTSPEGKVATSKDWYVLEEMIKVYKSMYPSDYRSFARTASAIRVSHRNTTGGIAKEHGGAEIRHTLELPQKLYEMLMVMFPRQNLDKEFVYKFANILPEFKAIDRL